MATMNPDTYGAIEPQPSIFRWIIGFLMVGACWGLTTPFMRRAAMYGPLDGKPPEAHQRRNYTPPQHPSLADPKNSWLRKKVLGIWYAVTGVLSRPAYAVPLLLNVTGSIWFFVLIGQAELSLTVPITNSLAFLFTVLGEWWAEKKVISRGEFKQQLKQCKADNTQTHGLAWHLCSVVSHYAFKASHRLQLSPIAS
jgi:hypothetical protein